MSKQRNKATIKVYGERQSPREMVLRQPRHEAPAHRPVRIEPVAAEQERPTFFDRSQAGFSLLK